jgi:hypothetical protein
VRRDAFFVSKAVFAFEEAYIHYFGRFGRNIFWREQAWNGDACRISYRVAPGADLSFFNYGTRIIMIRKKAHPKLEKNWLKPNCGT